MFSLLFSLLLAWLAGHPASAILESPQGADVAAHGHVSTAPVEIPAPETASVEGPAGMPPEPSPAPATVVLQPPVADDSGVGQLLCQPGEEWDGLRCVAVQLPEEAQGRASG